MEFWDFFLKVITFFIIVAPSFFLILTATLGAFYVLPKAVSVLDAVLIIIAVSLFFLLGSAGVYFTTVIPGGILSF